MLEEQKNDDNNPVAPDGSDAGPVNQEKKNIKNTSLTMAFSGLPLRTKT